VSSAHFTTQVLNIFQLEMASCVPKVMILGHSFVRRLQNDLDRNFDSRAQRDFNLEGTKVRLFGVGGRTVEKVKKLDLSSVARYTPDVVILEIGTNDLTTKPPQSVGSEIDDLANLLLSKYSIRVVCVCYVIPRKDVVFNENVKVLNQYLSVVIDHPQVFTWRHKGLYEPRNEMILADGVHLNSQGQYALYRSYRGAIMKSLKILRQVDDM